MLGIKNFVFRVFAVKLHLVVLKKDYLSFSGWTLNFKSELDSLHKEMHQKLFFFPFYC